MHPSDNDVIFDPDQPPTPGAGSIGAAPLPIEPLTIADPDTPPIPVAAPVAPPWEALLERMDSFQRELGSVRQQVAQGTDAARQALEAQQMGAEQVRRFGRKLDQVASVVADSRLKDLAGGLLLFHDLIAGLTQPRSDGSTGDVKVFEMLLGQLRQLLASHGIEPIVNEGQVDYQLHRPMKQVPAASPEQDGQIVEVWRAGFRFGEQLLRPSDVVIATYTEPVKG